MNNERRIEEGDLLVSDGGERRISTVAMGLWSEGTVAPASNRPRATWYRPLMSHNYQWVESEAEIPPFVKATDEQMEILRRRYEEWMSRQGEARLMIINKDDIRL